jgi:cell division protein FtsQ
LSEDRTEPIDLHPRVEVEGSHRRRWPWIVFAVLAVIAVAGITSASPLLDVDRLVVRGAERTPVDEVVARSGLRTGEAMLAVPAGAAEERVEELPWVRSATVRREWPGRVVVEVEEREPVAAFAGAGEGGAARWLLVDEDGRRLAQVRKPPDGVVVIEGVGADGDPGTEVDDAAAGAVEVGRRLTPALRMRLPRVQVDAEGRLEVVLRVEEERDAVAVLGRPEQLRDKLLSLATVLDSVELDDLSRIDLRIPGAPVLTRVASGP